MTDTTEIGKVKLTKVRLSYPALFKPKPGIDDPSKKKYMASFIFDKTDEKNKKAIEKAYEEVCKAAFNGKVPNFKGDSYPIRDGDETTKQGEDRGPEYAGKFYVTAKNDRRPVLKDGQKNTLHEDDGTLYGGCYVNAIIRLYAVDNSEKKIKGVFASLEGVMYAAKGEAFGASAVSDSEFDDFEDAEEEESEF
jgi:hypothetical protein